MTTGCQNIAGLRLGYVLKEAQNALRTRMDSDLRDLGLSASSYAALAMIEKTPGVSNAELARLSFVTPQSMQGIMSGLLDKKLVTRKSDPHHGRVLKTALTPAGAKLLAEAHAIVNAVENKMVKGLTRPQKLAAIELLASCAANLKGQ